MRVILWNVLAVVVGLALGNVVNLALVTVGPSLIPLPAGVEVTDAASLAAAMPQFEARHFVMPFLAHALGTFVGAFAAALLAASRREVIAVAIGVVFLAGGIAASLMIPAPAWFVATDLVLAYLPMAWIGLRLAGRLR